MTNEDNFSYSAQRNKSPFEIMQQSYPAEIMAKLFQKFNVMLPAGIAETAIEKYSVDFLNKYQCEAASRGYRNFPADISICKNEVIAHGVPSANILKEDDVVTVDIVCKYRGWYADMSWTYGVEKMSEETKHLLDATWKVSRAGLCRAEVGNTLRDVAQAISHEAKKNNVYVYTQFVGHGIGVNLHEEPYIIYDTRTTDTRLTSGMVVCIEPIVSINPQAIMTKDDGSYVGVKGYKTAVYEHMLAIFEAESKVLSYHMQTPNQMPKSHPHLEYFR